jgi:hypothetical protein
LGALKAARRNQLQRSVNLLHGSVLASIGPTIPGVLTIGMISNRTVTLGIEGGNFPVRMPPLLQHRDYRQQVGGDWRKRFCARVKAIKLRIGR